MNPTASTTDYIDELINQNNRFIEKLRNEIDRNCELLEDRLGRYRKHLTCPQKDKRGYDTAGCVTPNLAAITNDIEVKQGRLREAIESQYHLNELKYHDEKTRTQGDIECHTASDTKS